MSMCIHVLIGGDQLIDYNGKTFKYDNMGRPLVYKGDICTWSQRGELKSVKKDNQEAFKYYYDANGIRNKRIVNGVETKFVVVGTKILKSIIKVGNEQRTIKYKYVLDKLGGFVYTKDGISKEYRYERNIFGDITRILIVRKAQNQHMYDAYGRVKVINSIGEEDTNIEFIGNINLDIILILKLSSIGYHHVTIHLNYVDGFHQIQSNI